MRTKPKDIDFYTLIPVLLLLAIGIIMLLSASSIKSLNLSKNTDPYIFFFKQIQWSVLGIIALFIGMKINYREYKGWTKWIMLGSVIVLILVIVFAKDVNGAKSWISFGSFAIQPSEFVKLATMMVLAKSLAVKREKVKDLKEGFLPALAIIGLICGLIILQKDLGSTMVLGLAALVVIFVGGARISHLGGLMAIGLGFVVSAIAYAPYRINRIITFLHPWDDPQGKGYQIGQSLMAIGSGGFAGKGLGQGMQKYGWLPEMHNDFIFSVIGEELGFLGAIFIISLFAFFIYRGFLIARKAPDSFGSLLAVGITSMILVEMVINVAVATGSMPVTGVTLPFISYGGSSLIPKMAGVGILLNISRYRRAEKAENKTPLEEAIF
jgi:cell division protein FtsW